MSAVETWDWGFTYLCPKCNHWTAYDAPRAQPKWLSYTLTFGEPRLRPKTLIARFDCENCGEDLSINVTEFTRG